MAATIFVVAVVTANGQSGGQFTVERSVIANGGATTSSGGPFTVAGTTGQSFAGGRSYGPSLSLHGGFWQPTAFSPTSAEVSISGQITTAEGRGIKGVVVVLAEGNGSLRTSLSGPFGYYSFDGVIAGQTVVVTVQAKRYSFIQPTTIINLVENINEVNFAASN